jgi:hypothetical protein
VEERAHTVSPQKVSPPSAAGGPNPNRVAVDLTPKSLDALLRAARLAGLNRTDTINRAIQLYDFVLDILEENPDNAMFVMRNGKPERIELR